MNPRSGHLCHCRLVSPADLAIVNVESPLLGPDVCAIGITDGRFSHFWTSASDVAARTSIDAQNCSVLPGIDDSHLHGYEYGRSLTAVDLGRRAAPDLGSLREILRGCAREPNGWIRGIGWDGTDFVGSGPSGTLSAADIDDVTADAPAILTDVTGHQALVNSTALRSAGIGSGTPDPPGGCFVRDDSGMPTGLVLEAAVGLINEAIPELSQREREEAIDAAQGALLRQGVVAFTDPGLGPGARTLMDGTGDMGAVQAYRALDEGGRLKMRVSLMLLFGGLGGTTSIDVRDGLIAFGEPRQMRKFSRLGISQLKVFADGIPRSRTAWMSDPYDDCTHGKLQIAGDSDGARVAELHGIVGEAASRGWQVGVHAIGDRAITHVIDALAEPQNAPKELRHYVIHGDFIAASDIARMGESGLTLNSNPSIRWQVGGSVATIIGDERNARRQPLRAAVDAGVNVCLSSDAPVSPPDWRVIFAAAVTRSWRSDPGRSDDQRLTTVEALQALTTNGAWQSRADTWRGRLQVGHAADLVLLDRRVDWHDPWSITEASVIRTLIQGETVFEE